MDILGVLFIFALFASVIAILLSVNSGYQLYKNSKRMPVQYRTTAKLIAWNLLEPGVTSLYVIITFCAYKRNFDYYFTFNILHTIWNILLTVWPMFILLLPGIFRPFLAYRSEYLMPVFYLGLARIVITVLTFLFLFPIIIGLPLLFYSTSQIYRWHGLLNTIEGQALSVGTEGMMIVKQSNLEDSVKINL